MASFGLATTMLWFSAADVFDGRSNAKPTELLFSLVLIVILTSANLCVRWLRWHYLLRSLELGIKAQDSLKIWLATLPTIATPFYLGELIRAFLLSKRYPKTFWSIVGVWFAERLADLVVLAAILSVTQAAWVALAGVLGIGFLFILILRIASRGFGTKFIAKPGVMSVLVLSTGLAWMFPVLGLWAAFSIVGAPIALMEAAMSFTLGTLTGGLTGLPVGIGVTGSILILHLQSLGVGLETVTIVVFVFRTGTVWYALSLGVFGLIYLGNYLKDFLNTKGPRGHFDFISADYERNIPRHVQERLINRKIMAMEERLKSVNGDGQLKGLDIGCGPGWYAVEMVKRGYDMSACDLSSGQMENAKQHARRTNRHVKLIVADAGTLPLPSGLLDFAYSINVFHHIRDLDERRKAFSEAARVLKPGGRFFLHEINTANPIFRFYMDYVFPLLNDIDEGTEQWLSPKMLPEVDGAVWEEPIHYFNFLPDFVPAFLMRPLISIEWAIENSSLRSWSSHYVATCLIKK